MTFYFNLAKIRDILWGRFFLNRLWLEILYQIIWLFHLLIGFWTKIVYFFILTVFKPVLFLKKLLDKILPILIKPIPRLSNGCFRPEVPSEIFLLVLIIAMKNNLFILLPVWKNTFSLIEPHILFLKYSDYLLHFVFMLKVKEEAPLWVDEVVCEMFWHKCKR